MLKDTWALPLMWWIFVSLPTTALCLGMYSVGQQVLRQSINDVPVQMAEDTAAGAPVPSNKVDIAASLSPFVIVYDKSGTPVGGNGYLNGQWPAPPPGVFEDVSFWAHGHSWEPEFSPEVRVDAAIVPYSGGYVLAGRNMREMELHIIHLGGLVFAGWLALEGAILVTSYMLWLLLRLKN
jgi:hypothetical protein